MHIDSFINDAVSFIMKDEERRFSAAKSLAGLRNSPFTCKAAEEGSFAFPVSKCIPEGKVAAVDSGFVGRRLASTEIVFIRAVGVVFSYAQGKLVSCDYHPGYYRFPEPKIGSNGLDADEAMCSASLIRLLEELKAAEETIKRHKPSFCLLDGSIIPQYADKPKKGSKVHRFYKSIIDEFQKLYAVAEKNNCCLVGCVEDSRGSRVREILQKQVLPERNLIEPALLDDLTDSLLLDPLLSMGERSFSFPYTSSVKEHPILMDYGSKWADSVYGLYLKAAELDRPLRVEFLRAGNEDLTAKADAVASLVYALSCMHREYAYPSVLIEADLRARLMPEEIETVYNKIMDRLGAGSRLSLRRSNRPF
jgi:hypothetical protein